MNEPEFLDAVGREYDLGASGLAYPGPEPQLASKTRLYGGLAARYWVGDPGVSDLVAGIAYLYEPIRVEDQDGVRGELVEAFHQRVVEAVHQKTGLEISPHDLARMQSLECWAANPDLVERCKAFEQGWSALRPAGKGVRDLTGKDISQLLRRAGAKAER